MGVFKADQHIKSSLNWFEELRFILRLNYYMTSETGMFSLSVMLHSAVTQCVLNNSEKSLVILNYGSSDSIK